MKIAVTGFHGRLGSALVLAGCDPLDCDITNTESIQQALYGTSFDVLINCAALTCVDEAESEEGYKKFIQVNTHGVANLRDVFKGRMIQISTDYVFSGKSGPYRENNRQERPVNNYGFSKMGGEAIMISFAKQGDTTVRTTGLFGSPHLTNDLVNFIVHEVRSGRPVEITDDLRGNQTYIPFLAEHLIQLAEMSNPPKLLHLASSDVMSRYEFALLIADVFHLDKKYIMPCKSTDKCLNWVAPRPTMGGLDTTLSKKKYGFVGYTVKEGLQHMYEMGNK